MGGESRKKGERTRFLESLSSEGIRRLNRTKAEIEHQHRVTWRAQGRRQYVEHEPVGVRCETTETALVCLRIFAQSRRGFFYRFFENRRGSIIERMGERGRRVDPLQPILRKGQRSKEGRCNAERVDGGTDVVDVSIQSQR